MTVWRPVVNNPIPVQVSSPWWYSPSSAHWCSWFAICSATRGPTTPMRPRERSRPSPPTRPSSGLSHHSRRPSTKARKNGSSESPPIKYLSEYLNRTASRGGGWDSKLSSSEKLYIVTGLCPISIVFGNLRTPLNIYSLDRTCHFFFLYTDLPNLSWSEWDP